MCGRAAYPRPAPVAGLVPWAFSPRARPVGTHVFAAERSERGKSWLAGTRLSGSAFCCSYTKVQKTPAPPLVPRGSRVVSRALRTTDFAQPDGRRTSPATGIETWSGFRAVGFFGLGGGGR